MKLFYYLQGTQGPIVFYCTEEWSKKLSEVLGMDVYNKVE